MWAACVGHVEVILAESPATVPAIDPDIMAIAVAAKQYVQHEKTPCSWDEFCAIVLKAKDKIT